MVPSDQKASIVALILHLIFMLFRNHRPEAMFQRILCRSRFESAFFNRFWFPVGLQNGPLELNFQSKRWQKVYPAIRGTHAEANWGATWHRKRSKDTFSSIWDRFLQVLEGFWKDFGRTLQGLSINLGISFQCLLIDF